MPTRITVHVQPKAKTREVTLREDGSLRARVTAAPEDGKANMAVCDLVAGALGIPKRDVEVQSGHKSREKVLVVALGATEVARLMKALRRQAEENTPNTHQPEHYDQE